MIKKKVIVRQIEAGEHVTDDYEFRIPEDAGNRIEIKATWKYRKLNQAFVNWAFSEKGATMPVAQVAALTRTFDLESPGKGF
jgi:hypothetical protein